MQEQIPQALTRYIREFQYYSHKASSLPWYLRTVLYLPFGAIVQNYWIHMMSKCNRDFEKKWLNNKQQHG